MAADELRQLLRDYTNHHKHAYIRYDTGILRVETQNFIDESYEPCICYYTKDYSYKWSYVNDGAIKQSQHYPFNSQFLNIYEVEEILNLFKLWEFDETERIYVATDGNTSTFGQLLKN